MGAEAKGSSASEERICPAWVWRPSLGWHRNSTRWSPAPPVLLRSPMGSAIDPVLPFITAGGPAALVGSYWVTAALHGCVAFGGGGH